MAKKTKTKRERHERRFEPFFPTGRPVAVAAANAVEHAGGAMRRRMREDEAQTVLRAVVNPDLA